MPTSILFRRIDQTDETDDEYRAACANFNVVTSRVQLPPNSLCIGRYSVLPFYQEVFRDTSNLGSRLINTPEQHHFVADMEQFYPVIKDLTPATYTTWANLPEGSYVLKGRTNSRKHSWASRMFAPSLKDIPSVAKSLLDDTLIASQGLIIRKFVPLRTYDKGINDLPITNEWRFFCLDGQILDSGYYWANFQEYQWNHLVESAPTCRDDVAGTGWFATVNACIGRGKTEEAALADLARQLVVSGMSAEPPRGATKIVKQAIPLIAPHVRFFVVDVAETAEGDWIVIELNEGQQAGLCCIPPSRFYQRLREALGA